MRKDSEQGDGSRGTFFFLSTSFFGGKTRISYVRGQLSGKKSNWEMDITGKDGPGEKRIRGYL